MNKDTERETDRGVESHTVAAQAGKPDADPFDLLCHLAFNAPVLTRRQRADRMKKQQVVFFNYYAPKAGSNTTDGAKYAEEKTEPWRDRIIKPERQSLGNILRQGADTRRKSEFREVIAKLRNCHEKAQKSTKKSRNAGFSGSFCCLVATFAIGSRN